MKGVRRGVVDKAPEFFPRRCPVATGAGSNPVAATHSLVGVCDEIL